MSQIIRMSRRAVAVRVLAAMGVKMKRSVSVFCLVFLFCAALFPACGAAEGNFDSLTDWNVRIAVPEGTTAVLKGSEYYIYAGG